MHYLLSRFKILVFVFLLCSQGAVAQSLTVILDWFPNPNHGPLLVAQAKGYFAQKGLDVKLISPSDPSEPPKWVAMGRGDIAIDYQPHVMLAQKQGLPIEQIGTLIDQPLNNIVWLKKPRDGLKSLRGQSIAYSSPEIDLPILRFLLQQQSLTLKDVTAVNVHYNLMQALLSGRVNAAIGLSRNIELITLRRLQPTTFALNPEDFGVPAYSELVYITKKGKIDPRFALFFDALNEAATYIHSHPEESWQEVIKLHSELKSADNHAAWLVTVPMFTSDTHKINAARMRDLTLFFNQR